MKIYFDVCAIGRLTDDQSQGRIRDEAEAVETAFRLVSLGIHEWVTSAALFEEIGDNPNHDRRQDALELIGYSTTKQPLTDAVLTRALNYQAAGLGEYDAIHLAAALEAGCDALITTDDRFVRRASHIRDLPAHFVRYPGQI